MDNMIAPTGEQHGRLRRVAYLSSEEGDILKIMIKAISTTALFIFFAGSACAQTNGLVGRWTNVDTNTGGVTRLVVSQDKDSCIIQAWGKCHPTDCDWGRVELRLLGDDPVGRYIGWTNRIDPAVRYGFAHWDSGFADTYLTLRIEGATLVGETFTLFEDKSQRLNYRSTYCFRKE